jgi:hypothetical protein
MEQVPPEERLQVAGDGRTTVPEPPEGCKKVIVSPVTVPIVPVTVAVHVEVEAIAMDEGEQATPDVVVLVLGE